MTEAATQAESALPTIVGFIDAIAGETIYGWAWDRRQPGERLIIRFRIGEEEIGTAIADQERDDLKGSKIGDGRHAFVFHLPAGREAELDRLEILAMAPSDGAPVRLAMPAPEDRAATGNPDAHDLLARLVHSHRLLHRTLQSGLTELKEQTAAGNFDELRSAQEELKEQLRSLEVFIVRLDGVVHELNAAVKGVRRRSAEPATVALLVLVALAAGGSFALELLSYLL